MVDDEHVHLTERLGRGLDAPRRAGFTDVRVRGEELLANWFGWTNRVLEASADPETVPLLWRRYAYRGYLLMQALDRTLLEPRLPPAVFYNLLLSSRKRGDSAMTSTAGLRRRSGTSAPGAG